MNPALIYTFLFALFMPAAFTFAVNEKQAQEYLSKPIFEWGANELLEFVKLLDNGPILRQESYSVSLQDASIFSNRIWVCPQENLILIEKSQAGLEKISELHDSGHISSLKFETVACWKNGIQYFPLRFVEGALMSVSTKEHSKYGPYPMLTLDSIVAIQIEAYRFARNLFPESSRAQIESIFQYQINRPTSPEKFGVSIKEISSEKIEIDMNSENVSLHIGKNSLVRRCQILKNGVTNKVITNKFFEKSPIVISKVLEEIQLLEDHGPHYHIFREMSQRLQYGALIQRQKSGQYEFAALDYLGSAYLSGVREGDVLVSINTYEADKLEIHELLKLINEGEQINISVMRGDKVIKIGEIRKSIIQATRAK